MNRAADFFQYACERYSIMLAKNNGQEPPWTNDWVLQQYRFCNVFREDDKVTTWIRENVREPMRNDPSVLGALVIARWFNKIETLEILKSKDACTSWHAPANLFYHWDLEEMAKRLRDQKPLVTGAYIIKTPNGMNKLDGIIWCLQQFLPFAEQLCASIEQGEITLEHLTNVLAMYPYLGQFMAYEVVTDMRHTDFMKDAPDIMTWANPGPGAARGLGRVMCDDPTAYQTGRKRDSKALMSGMHQLLDLSTDEQYWPQEWPSWEMREVEHTLCEFDKYDRAHNEEGRPKQKYRRE